MSVKLICVTDEPFNHDISDRRESRGRCISNHYLTLNYLLRSAPLGIYKFFSYVNQAEINSCVPAEKKAGRIFLGGKGSRLRMGEKRRGGMKEKEEEKSRRIEKSETLLWRPRVMPLSLFTVKCPDGLFSSFLTLLPLLFNPPTSLYFFKFQFLFYFKSFSPCWFLFFSHILFFFVSF